MSRREFFVLVQTALGVEPEYLWTAYHMSKTNWVSPSSPPRCRRGSCKAFLSCAMTLWLPSGGPAIELFLI